MRGKAARQATMLTAITPDTLVPQRHPIRRSKPMVDRALVKLSPPLTGCTLQFLLVLQRSVSQHSSNMITISAVESSWVAFHGCRTQIEFCHHCGDNRCQSKTKETTGF